MITQNKTWYERISERIESKTLVFSILATAAILVGGLIEIPPFFLRASAIPSTGVSPYSALELAGRDTFQREGCFYCHTQMVRPFKWETDRWDRNREYGPEPYSKAGDYIYDHPFLWGSKRTGPDLAHEGGLNPNPSWHKQHLIDPRSTSPGSIMPAFAHLFEEDIDPNLVRAEMMALQMIGVPYSDEEIDRDPDALVGLKKGDAVIAYLMKLGRDQVHRKAEGGHTP